MAVCRYALAAQWETAIPQVAVLFHETDRITFKEGYTNRRTNITMLYGKREEAAKQQRYQK